MKAPARYAAAEGAAVRCRLCPNLCLVAEGRSGRCLGRQNVGGTLCATTYGELVSTAVDPMEKKPLYHFHPGAPVFSVATYGCNLLCPFCQNSEISQSPAPARYVAPAALVEMVRQSGCRFVAYTYSEPLVWFEYLMDAGRLMRQAGIGNVLVTNGMVNPEPLAELLPLVDAMNVDLKSIRPGFYRDYVKGDLATVLGTIRAARRACHVELTTLLIPGRNDSDAELEELVRFVAGLGRGTVLHFSRYFPRYRASEPPTPLARLVRAGEIASRELDYVYIGNAGTGPEYRDTLCPGCRTLLVDRSAYTGEVRNVVGGKCTGCGRAADIVL
ncbi:AmmeMemoRadiSam system radical SAM enzyme [candidate division WOR-3 bacterium]|nr:AmmeMemoRadiSam system radical SAM enzyme [candidate division WOR-3 bacterium]